MYNLGMETYQSRNIIYCPKCQTKLVHNGKSANCPNCDFTYYLNPAPTTVVLFVKDNQVLLGKRAIEPKKDLWDLPGGFIDVGESAEQGAIREAKEETGLDVKIVKYLGSAPDIYGDTLVPTLIFVYVVEILGGEMTPQDDISELKWFALDQVPEIVAFATVNTSLDLLRNFLAQKW